jgi:hypothetical protein
MEDQEIQHELSPQSVNYQDDSKSSQQQFPQKPNNTGIPDDLKRFIEAASGVSLDEVRVFYNSEKPAEIGAFAYAEYPNIYIAPGQEKHLAEEVWHIVQQMRGEVSATTSIAGKKVNDKPELEEKAKTEGAKADRGTVDEDHIPELETSGGPSQKVSQLATADPNSKTTESYEEYNKRRRTGRGMTTVKSLRKITDEQYNDAAHSDPVTQEEGYTIYDISAAENQADWQTNNAVVQKYRDPAGNYHIRKNAGFSLPVSCIESAEHIVHYAHVGGAIPDWESDQAGDKSVNLALDRTGSGNENALNISRDEIDTPSLTGYQDYDFNAGALNVGDGLLVVKAADPTSSVHAVAVVAKNTATGQFIVLERNAGMTSGDNNYVDADWTLNIYDSPAAFKASMPDSDQYIMGRLRV